MIMKKLICCALLGTLLVSCFQDLPRKVRMRSFVSTYYTATSGLTFSVYDRPNIPIEANAVIVTFTQPLGYDVSYKSEGADEKKYDALCEKHGDMSYNRKVTILGYFPITPNQFIVADFLSVDIISDADFDAAHPAGASLGDIVKFISVSPYPYIKSGYKAKYDWDNSVYDELIYHNFLNTPYTVKGGPFEKCYHAVEKMVSELTSEDLTLLGDGDTETNLAILKFVSKPTLAQTHNLTITFTPDSGRPITGTVTMEF